VVIAGVIILLTGWLYADPLISVGIAALIAWGGIRIVTDTVNILLEAAPRGVDIERVRELIAATEGVTSVHDLHIWSLSPEQLALSCHVVVGLEASAVDTEHLVRALEAELCGSFNIGHTTIQAEACHPCDPEGTHGPGEHNHPHVRAQAEPPLPHRHL
jgi:cobalt-zinc-cadmium efflux system protein